MKLVAIESPYAGEVLSNLAYLRRAMADALARGEAPYASHALYTQEGVLDDTKPEERKLGIDAGFAWADRADEIAFYLDRGWSGGMISAFSRWQEKGKRISLRMLGQTVGTIEPRPGVPLKRDVSPSAGVAWPWPTSAMGGRFA